MDANQGSEVNNQTDNGANEKWTPGSKGNTTTGPMDHTYPKGASQQQSIRGETDMAGAVQSDLPGGSMQSQQTGGTGPQQGITDSHQRQMEQHSGAWGMLEQPVGRRDKHSGTDVHAHPATQQGNSQAAQAMNPQEGFYSNQQSATRGGEGTGMATPHQQGNAQKSTDHGGSQTGTGARDTGSHDVHQSNDVAGGLPRSPGNSGPTSDEPGWLPAQSVDAEKNPVRDSNDLGGGLPKSPAGANQLAGDRKMDDDTGFSRG